jgi:hypothetical protein
VKLSVGVDVGPDKVELTIKGVEAQALLKVRLEQVRAILDKALTTIGESPRILQSLVRTVGQDGRTGRWRGPRGGVRGRRSRLDSRRRGEATERVSGAAGQAMAEGGRTASQVVGRVTASGPRTGAAMVTECWTRHRGRVIATDKTGQGAKAEYRANGYREEDR